MNSFLRALGFSKYKTKQSMQDIISAASLYPETMDYINNEENGKIYEFTHFYGDSFGIKFYGTESDDYDYDIDSFIPFIEGSDFFIPQDLCIEKRYSGFSFLASCENLRIGVSIIFHIINPIDYVNYVFSDKNIIKYLVAFSALSVSGTILLPISQSPGDAKRKQETVTRRANLLAAARMGDEQAIEQLTFEDMDTYAKISKRIHNEDVFTIVESSFMPYGLENDLYSIIADITEVREATNTLTGEPIYILKLSYNGVIITTAINKLDIVGEPLKGRRFKGVIWLQGIIKFIKNE